MLLDLGPQNLAHHLHLDPLPVWAYEPASRLRYLVSLMGRPCLENSLLNLPALGDYSGWP